MKYKIITLCGSSKFEQEFAKVQFDLTLQGNIVLSLPLFSQFNNQQLTQEQLSLLSECINKRLIWQMKYLSSIQMVI